MSKSKLHDIRERLHLTQTLMASKLHKSQSAYAKLESGKTSLKKEDIILLLQEFGEEAGDILEEYSITLKISIENKIIINGIGQLNKCTSTLEEKVTLTKDGEIAYLKSIIKNLLSLKD